MITDKDNCCFCVPLGVAAALIGCTVGTEVMMALTSRQMIPALLQLFLLATFIMTACNRDNRGWRKCLAYSYASLFAIYLLFISLATYGFFMNG